MTQKQKARRNESLKRFVDFSYMNGHRASSIRFRTHLAIQVRCFSSRLSILLRRPLLLGSTTPLGIPILDCSLLVMLFVHLLNYTKRTLMMSQ